MPRLGATIVLSCHPCAYNRCPNRAGAPGAGRDKVCPFASYSAHPGEGDSIPPSLPLRRVPALLLEQEGRPGALGCLGCPLPPAFLPRPCAGAACVGVWSDKAKELISASPLPLCPQCWGLGGCSRSWGCAGSWPRAHSAQRWWLVGKGPLAGVDLLRIQPQRGGGGGEGDHAPPVSMATAPLDRSPSLPGCSCPGNPRALWAPAALGHAGFGEGGPLAARRKHWGGEDDVPPP